MIIDLGEVVDAGVGIPSGRKFAVTLLPRSAKSNNSQQRNRLPVRSRKRTSALCGLTKPAPSTSSRFQSGHARHPAIARSFDPDVSPRLRQIKAPLDMRPLHMFPAPRQVHCHYESWRAVAQAPPRHSPMSTGRGSATLRRLRHVRAWSDSRTCWLASVLPRSANNGHSKRLLTQASFAQY